MTQAIDQIMEGGGPRRQDVAHAVFTIAREAANIDAAELASMARERLAARLRSSKE
jgi:hypothetical protein